MERSGQNLRQMLNPPQAFAPDTLPQAYKETFSTDQGQRVLDDLCKQVQSKLSNADIDPNKAVWVCARQNLVHYVMQKIADANKKPQ